MATLDLRTIEDAGFVLHFGGRTHEVDVHTFGNALVSIAETIRAINSEVNPGYSIEVSIEAVGPGSFRARLRTAKKSLRNLFSVDNAQNLVLALFASFLWDKALNPDHPPVIIVNEDAVIIEHGGDRVIVPKAAYDQLSHVERSPAVNRHVARTMDVLEADPSVESFGLAKNLQDEAPVIEIPRALFPTVRTNVISETKEGHRHRDANAILTVHKAVFERSARKWEFIWEGFKISAPILDSTFFDRLERREVALGQGDALEATLRIHQVHDPATDAWLNSSYEVLMVGQVIQRPAP